MKLEDEIQQKEFKDEFQKAHVNIIYTYNWVESKHKDFFKQYDLTPQQFNILRILRGQHPKPCTVNLLKERMLDKMSDASRIVERLRIKELLVRAVCPSDRRSVDVAITKKGLDLLKRMDLQLEEHNREMLKSLTAEEAKQLNALLDKLRG